MTCSVSDSSFPSYSSHWHSRENIQSSVCFDPEQWVVSRLSSVKFVRRQLWWRELNITNSAFIQTYFWEEWHYYCPVIIISPSFNLMITREKIYHWFVFVNLLSELCSWEKLNLMIITNAGCQSLGEWRLSAQCFVALKWQGDKGTRGQQLKQLISIFASMKLEVGMKLWSVCRSLEFTTWTLPTKKTSKLVPLTPHHKSTFTHKKHIYIIYVLAILSG